MANKDTGHGRGKNYSVNFPLKDGIDDESYKAIFQPVSLLLHTFWLLFLRTGQGH